MSTRPRSITLIGWLFITVGCLGVLMDLLPLVTHNTSQEFAGLRREGASEFGPAWASRLVVAIGGGAPIL